MYLTSFLITLGLTFTLFWQNAESYSHNALVAYYHKAAKDEKVAEEFHALMANYKGKDPLKLGYKAVSNAIMAKHAWSPYNKIKYLRASAEVFDQAVALDKLDPEVRFLRYSIENNIPRYLKMSHNLEEDKKVFMTAMLKHPKSGIPLESMKIMRDYLLRKDLVSGDERKRVENLNL